MHVPPLTRALPGLHRALLGILVLAPLRLFAQGEDLTPPTVSISPSAGTVTNPSLTVTITWADNLELDPPSRSVTLRGADVTASFDYVASSVRNATSTGTVTLINGSNVLSARICDLQNGLCTTATKTYTYTPATTAVAVTPDGSAASPPAQATVTQAFTVQNTGTVTTTYAFTTICTGSAATGCTTPASVTLAANASTSVSVTYTAGAQGSTGEVRLRATATGAQDDGYVAVTAQTYTVAVAPDSTSDVVAEAANTLAFRVTNSGTGTGTYNLSTLCSGAAAGCVVSPASVTVAPGSTVGAQVTFSAGLDTGTVRLIAAYPGVPSIADTGTMRIRADFPCQTQFSRIAACSSSVTNPAMSGTGLSADFTLTNFIPTEPSTFSVQCSIEGVVSWCSFHPDTTITTSSVSSVPAAGGQKIDTVYYRTSGTLSTGRVTIHARGNVDNVSARVLVTVTYNTPTPVTQLEVTPEYQHVTASPGSARSAAFRITNHGSGRATVSHASVCTGAGVASGCAPTPISIDLDPGASTVQTVSLTAGGTVGTTGTARLTAWLASASAVRDSGAVELGVVAAPVPGVVIADPRPGTSVERDLCLTIAAGSAAGYECGDLRVAHALPAVRTLGKARVPSLVYNSAHAHPVMVVGADVTLPADGRVPTLVIGDLLVNGVTRASAMWSGSDWALASTRRIALSYDASTDATGIYPVTVQVRREYADASSQTDLATGELTIVNRGASEFGAGWWLAGLERLTFVTGGAILWIGGDGSTRKYTSAGTNRWAAESLDRPDTLTWDGTQYVRQLPNGLQVRFGADGTHRETRNRLGLRHRTVFAYDGSSRLQTIQLPPWSTATPERPAHEYTFTYGTGRLATVVAPNVAGTTRSVVFAGANSRIESITDADNTTVSFGYDATVTRRMTSRTDRRLTVTRYLYGPAAKLSQATIELDSGQTIVTRFVPQETRGVAGTAAVSPDASYTLLDGPRTDVGDSTLFWLERFGSPRKIRDALGNETVLTRGDARWPALVTRLRAPTGQILGSVYDTRGRITATTDSTRYDAVRAKYATSNYQWTTAPWDLIETITLPEGEVTSFGYDTQNGNRLWQQPGTDPARRVQFFYGNALALPSSTLVPGSVRDSLDYDGLGNLRFAQTPRGAVYRTWFHKDTLGRDSLVVSPIDAAGTYTLRQSVWYDRADQDTLQRTDSPGISESPGGALARTLFVRKIHDGEGNVLSHAQWSIPDTNVIGTVTRSWTYDRANRVKTEIAPGPWQDDERFTYDPAGNVTARWTRRNKTITTTYDALNRPAQRVVPEVPISLLNHTWGTLPADTARFGYDAGGRILWANNRFARITRRYDVGGALLTDTLRVRISDPLVNHFDLHTYGLRYAYDLNGRRTTLKYPAGLMPSGKDSVTYRYDPALGALQTVTDPYGHLYTFGYNNAGWLTSLAMPQGITETRTYYADGALETRTEGSAPRTIHSDALTYDARGKVRDVTALIPDYGGATDIFRSRYNGLGALVYSESFGEIKSVEDFQYDALGNFSRKTRSGGGAGAKTSTFVYQAGSGQLLETRSEGAVVGKLDTLRTAFDEAGNAERVYRARARAVAYGDGVEWAHPQTRHWYTADDRLAASEMVRDTAFLQDGVRMYYPDVYREHEEYWYDALGRRVWVRMHRGLRCEIYARETGCKSTVSRTVWDGDQLLVDIRYPEIAPEKDVGSVPNPQHYGRVAYVHGGEIDRPLALIRMEYGLDVIIPHWNYRGLFDTGTCLFGGVCSEIEWPAKTMTAYMEVAAARDTGAANWFGSLVEEKQDGSGLRYMRNRYYDPQTGRFTQEDPIGLAGGLNVYGYANGDPINFSDPFGLCAGPSDIKCPEGAEARRPGVILPALLEGAGKAAQAFWEKHGDVIIDVTLLALTRGQPGGSRSRSAGSTAGGRATDQYGNPLGPSGKPMVHRVKHSGEKGAKDAARSEGDGTPVKHSSPTKGERHYHATKKGEKVPGSTHHEYPRE